MINIIIRSPTSPDSSSECKASLILACQMPIGWKRISIIGIAAKGNPVFEPHARIRDQLSLPATHYTIHKCHIDYMVDLT